MILLPIVKEEYKNWKNKTTAHTVDRNTSMTYNKRADFVQLAYLCGVFRRGNNPPVLLGEGKKLQR